MLKLFYLIFLGIFLLSAKPILIYLDNSYFNSQLRNLYCHHIYSENFKLDNAKYFYYDYRWLENSPRPLLIAHALGGGGTLKQNTIQALNDSFLRGFTFYEVDVYLYDGILRCHHGPQLPKKYTNSDCTLTSVLSSLGEDQYVVLDIKSDFNSTLSFILHSFDHNQLKKLIFQLYSSDNLKRFNLWVSKYELNGPIFTTYKSRSSIDLIASYLLLSGVKVITVSIERLNEFKLSSSLNLLVHPMTDCDSYKKYDGHSNDGYYLSNNLVKSGQIDCD